MRIPRVAWSLGRGERVVLSLMGVLTLLHRAGWLSSMDGLSCEFLGEFVSIRTRRRTVFARRLISATSCRTDLGQRWRGRVPLVGGGATFWGNIDVAVAIASPRMSWSVLASSRMWVMVSSESSRLPSGDMWPVGESRDSLRERAVALANMVGM